MSAAPTRPDASPHVSPGDSSQSSGAIVPTAGHTDFDGETEASDNTEAAVQRIGTGGSLLSMGKQRAMGALEPRAVKTPTALLSPPETIAERLLEALRVERSDEGTSESLLLPEHWIDTAMVAELLEDARKLLKERARQDSKSGDGGGGGGASGEGKDTASSSGSFLGTISRAGKERLQQSSREIVAPFEVAVGIKPHHRELSHHAWSKGPDGKPEFALRKRPGRVVKLVPVVDDSTGTERCKDGSIILRDETMLMDRIHACSPRLSKCIGVIPVLGGLMFLLSGLLVTFALPFAILKFTNTTDVLFGPPVANTSSNTSDYSNITSDYNGPPW